jgi:hypothetical protein
MTLKAYGAHDLVDALVKTDFTRANLAGAKLNQADVKRRELPQPPRPTADRGPLRRRATVIRRLSMRNKVVPAAPLIVAAGKNRQSPTINRS